MKSTSHFLPHPQCLVDQITLKEMLHWLEVVHCFNHQLELASKDAFQDIKLFQMIDEMLMKIYYLYQNLPQRPRELKAFSNALEEAEPNPSI